MHTLSRTAFITCIAMALTTGAFGQELSGAKKKKVIEWGWDEPTTKFVRKNIDKVEGMPFDGLVFHLTHRDGANVTWNMWGRKI